jgi:ABC-type sugar transport system ATPase subunit
MNLFSGGSISGNKLVLGDFLIPLPPRVFPLVQNNQPVTLGIRKEAVRILGQENLLGGVHLPAEVASIEADYVHRTQTVHLRTGQWNYSGLSSLDVSFRVGQLVQVELDPERLYFFDARSGLRI